MGRCPNCLSRLDRVTRVHYQQEPPDAGDVTVCLYCGAPLIFNEDGRMHLPTKPEVDAMTKQQKHGIMMARSVAVEYHRQNPSKAHLN